MNNLLMGNYFPEKLLLTNSCGGNFVIYRQLIFILGNGKVLKSNNEEVDCILYLYKYVF